MTTGAEGIRIGDFREDELVTGEAVTLDLPRAGLAPRIGAALLDVTIAVTVLTILSVFLTPALLDSGDTAFSQAVLLVTTVACLVGYPVTVETLTRGKSVGKLAAGIRTVRADGGPIGFRHALTRGLTGVVEIYLFMGIPATVCALLTARGQRLGDLAAGTYVVRERMGLRMSRPALMPPFLAAWATGADITPLPDSLALATRQFIGRAHTLTPQAREEIGRELYTELLRHVAPPPPPGMHPEYVMAAVLAERGRRDSLLIARHDAAAARLLPPDELDGLRHVDPAVAPAAPPSAPPGVQPRPYGW